MNLYSAINASEALGVPFHYDGLIYKMQDDEIVCEIPPDIEVANILEGTQGIDAYTSFDFRRQRKLREVTIPDSVRAIHHYGFANCPHIKCITLPKTLTTVDPFSFTGCTTLEYLNLEDVEQIGIKAFSYSGLREADLPYVEVIPRGAFEQCRFLESVKIPRCIRIHGEAFTGCMALSSIIIPKTIVQIDMGAFRGSGLREVVFQKLPRFFTEFEKVFVDCVLRRCYVPSHTPPEMRTHLSNSLGPWCHIIPELPSECEDTVNEGEPL